MTAAEMTAVELLVSLGVDRAVAEPAVLGWREHQQIDVAELLAVHMAADSIKAVCFGCGSFWTLKTPDWVGKQPHCWACTNWGCWDWGCEGSTVDDNRTSDVDGTRVRLPTAPQDGAA